MTSVSASGPQDQPPESLTSPDGNSLPSAPAPVGEIGNLLAIEYRGLREETLTRLRIQHEITIIALVAPATVLSIGIMLHDGVLLLLYPIFGMFLTLGWAHHDYRKRQIGYYVKNKIERHTGVYDGERNIGWEHYLVFSHDVPWLHYTASRGLFLIPQALAIYFGVAQSQLIMKFLGFISTTVTALWFGQRLPEMKLDPLDVGHLLLGLAAIAAFILTISILVSTTRQMRKFREMPDKRAGRKQKGGKKRESPVDGDPQGPAPVATSGMPPGH